ncbi:MAG TPA: hypothetical protein VNH19_17610 [Candidatus Limnocylindrales bacterium]|nr:hypothetical protein [Candidatus Limnocylindrales bacterium]
MRAALQECLKQMEDAASLLEFMPDDYALAINNAKFTLAALASSQPSPEWLNKAAEEPRDARWLALMKFPFRVDSPQEIKDWWYQFAEPALEANEPCTLSTELCRQQTKHDIPANPVAAAPQRTCEHED